MTKGTGYHKSLVAQVKAAPSSELGVKLGNMCIQHGVPVARVAKALFISRTTLYSWFKGATPVPPKHAQQVLNFMETIRKE